MWLLKHLSLTLVTALLSTGALAEDSIQKTIEKRFNVKVQDGVSVYDRITYDSFWGEEKDLAHWMGSSVCIVKTGKAYPQKTRCRDHSAMSDFMGLGLFLATTGHFGSTNGSYRDTSHCTAQRAIDLLLRTSYGATPKLEVRQIQIMATADSEQKFFKRSLKKQAKKAAREVQTVALEQLQQVPRCEGWGVDEK